MSSKPTATSGPPNGPGPSTSQLDGNFQSRTTQAIEEILAELNITSYEPAVVNMLIDYVHNYTVDLLDEARVLSLHAGKKQMDENDMLLAVRLLAERHDSGPPPREFQLELAKELNKEPLPLINSFSGTLPPDRFCLTAPEYQMKRRLRPAILQQLQQAGPAVAAASTSQPVRFGLPAASTVYKGTPQIIRALTASPMAHHYQPMPSQQPAGISQPARLVTLPTAGGPVFAAGPAGSPAIVRAGPTSPTVLRQMRPAVGQPPTGRLHMDTYD